MKFLEIILQTFLAFFTILIITRLLGRQQISQLSLHEYINGITFGSIAATLATDLDQHTYQHLIGLILFGVLTGLVSYISIKNRKFRKIISGEPILVIQHGKILEANLKRAKYSIDEFNELLREKDCFSPSDVEYGILEKNGKLSVIKSETKREVTLGDIGIVPKEQASISTEIIIGGQIIYQNLEKRELTGKELINQLKCFNVKRIEEVMYASIDENGKLYVDKFDDNIKDNTNLEEKKNRE